MKKGLLLFFAALGLCVGQSFGQVFTLDKDTSKGIIPNDLKAHVTNVTGSPVKVTWKILNHTFPASWMADQFGICDNITCWVYNPGSNLNVSRTTDDIQPGASTAMEFKLQMGAPSAPAGGPYYMTIEMRSGSDVKNLVFQTSKFPTGVTTVTAKNDDVVIYPNPAQSELNVLFDGNAGIKNIAVYNLIGKAVIVYKVSGSSAKLDLDSVPSGIYFIRLIDESGRVVAMRKFTHQ